MSVDMRKREAFHLIQLNANVSFLYSLKTSENLSFSIVFRRYRNETLM